MGGVVRVLASLPPPGHRLRFPRFLEESLRFAIGNLTASRRQRRSFSMSSLVCNFKHCKRAVWLIQKRSGRPVENCRTRHSRPHAVVRPLGLVIASRSLFDLRAPLRKVTNDMWRNHHVVPPRQATVDTNEDATEALLMPLLDDDCLRSNKLRLDVQLKLLFAAGQLV